MTNCLQNWYSSSPTSRPGFVSDDYLNAIAAETTTTVLELEAAGMWERRDGGYLVVADEMLKIAIDFNEKTDRLEAECARRGEHLPSDSDDGSGWVTCSHCTIPLERPDGGPVALPGGGPLGLSALAGRAQLRSVLPVRPDRPVISASSMSPCRASAAWPSSAAAPVSLAVAAACSAGVVTVVQSCAGRPGAAAGRWRPAGRRPGARRRRGRAGRVRARPGR